MGNYGRDLLIQENQCWLMRVQAVMLQCMDDELSKDEPTNWLGAWAKKKQEENKLLKL